MENIINFLRTDGTDNIIQLILFILAAFGWLIAAFYNRKISKNDKRLTIYTDVLEKIEVINQSFTESFSVSYSNSILNVQKLIINDPINSSNYLIEFMEENQKYLEQSMKLASSIFIQFARFRLVASAKTIEFFDKYKSKTLELINSLSSTYKDIQSNLTNPAVINNIQNSIDIEMKEKAEEVKSLFQELELQMKKDVGF